MWRLQKHLVLVGSRGKDGALGFCEDTGPQLCDSRPDLSQGLNCSSDTYTGLKSPNFMSKNNILDSAKHVHPVFSISVNMSTTHLALKPDTQEVTSIPQSTPSISLTGPPLSYTLHVASSLHLHGLSGHLQQDWTTSHPLRSCSLPFRQHPESSFRNMNSIRA